MFMPLQIKWLSSLVLISGTPQLVVRRSSQYLASYRLKIDKSCLYISKSSENKDLKICNV